MIHYFYIFVTCVQIALLNDNVKICLSAKRLQEYFNCVALYTYYVHYIYQTMQKNFFHHSIAHQAAYIKYYIAVLCNNDIPYCQKSLHHEWAVICG